MKVEQEKIKLEHEKIKLQLEMAKMQVEMSSMGQPKQPVPEYDPAEMAEKDRRFQLDAERLQLEKQRFAHQREKDMTEYGHKRRMDEAGLAMEAMSGA
jgi:hypothetical protein